MDDYEDCAATCVGAPEDCTCCSRYCEPYSYDEETGEAIYKDLYRTKEDEE